MSIEIQMSVVIPVYECRVCLKELVRRLKKTLEQIFTSYEIILVNDDSPDGSWDTITELVAYNKNIKGINLARNFGQHHAITAGLDYVRGRWVVVMDCDLQDQPEEIQKLYKKALEGFDIVFGKRANRKDRFLKIFSSKLYYRIFDYFTEQKSDNATANFGIFHRNVIRAFQCMKEQNRSFPLAIRWLGFKVSDVEVEHAKRFSGKTSYSYSKLISLAVDSIVTQSNKPLKLAIKFGFSMSFLSLLYAVYLIVRYIIYTIPVPGWTSVIVSIYFLSGIILANMGILGLYIGKIFNETKKRPLYVISEKIGF